MSELTGKALRDRFERGGANDVLRTFLKLHEGKVGQHWLWTAIERLVAGETEVEIMSDYGYVREKSHE